MYKIILFACILFSCASYSATEDVMCQDNLNKILICHAGDGNEEHLNYVSVCVDIAQVVGHLAEHEYDHLGECAATEMTPYVCNAGLYHPKPASDLCLNLNTGVLENSCTCSDGECSNCICSYAEQSSSHAIDFMNFSIASFVVLPPIYTDDDFNFEQRQLYTGTSDFAVATDEPESHIMKNDRALTFNLPTERLGAQYFVDTCWKMDNPVEGAVTFKTSTSEASSLIFNGYLSMAQVKTRAALFCDYEQDGPYHAELVTQTDFVSFYGGIKEYEFLTENPRFCFVRHYYKENEAVSFLRPNNLKSVTLLNTLNVEAPTHDSNMSFTMCHVEKVSTKGKKEDSYQCTTRQWTEASYIRYVTQTKNKYDDTPQGSNAAAKDWKDHHEHDYLGPCRVECGPLTGNNSRVIP